ncbi:MAG: prolyl oligopeptidase family serine peptidase [Victivallales bacterium]
MKTDFLPAGKLIKNESGKILKGYHPFYYQTKNGQKLNCRLYTPPNNGEKQKYPLVVHFHGAGSRGDNNSSQLRFSQKLTNKENAVKYPCFLFAPQCPADKKWVDIDWGELAHEIPSEPSSQMAMAMAAIDEIIKKYPVDTTRIYVYGQSMGAFATWDILCRRPDMFAAAVSVCGGGDENCAPRIAHVPVRIIHGALDPVVKVERSQNMFAALKKAGGSPGYTEYPKVRHNAWSYSYTPKLFAWMFSQKKGKKKNAAGR